MGKSPTREKMFQKLVNNSISPLTYQMVINTSRAVPLYFNQPFPYSRYAVFYQLLKHLSLAPSRRLVTQGATQKTARFLSPRFFLFFSPADVFCAASWLTECLEEANERLASSRRSVSQGATLLLVFKHYVNSYLIWDKVFLPEMCCVLVL